MEGPRRFWTAEVIEGRQRESFNWFDIGFSRTILNGQHHICVPFKTTRRRRFSEWELPSILLWVWACSEPTRLLNTRRGTIATGGGGGNGDIQQPTSAGNGGRRHRWINSSRIPLAGGSLRFAPVNRILACCCIHGWAFMESEEKVNANAQVLVNRSNPQPWWGLTTSASCTGLIILRLFYSNLVLNYAINHESSLQVQRFDAKFPSPFFTNLPIPTIKRETLRIWIERGINRERVHLFKWW